MFSFVIDIEFIIIFVYKVKSAVVQYLSNL